MILKGFGLTTGVCGKLMFNFRLILKKENQLALGCCPEGSPYLGGSLAGWEAGGFSAAGLFASAGFCCPSSGYGSSGLGWLTGSFLSVPDLGYSGWAGWEAALEPPSFFYSF